MATLKLAEALLRRKELQTKVDTLSQINPEALVVRVNKRIKVTDDLDDVIASVPRVSATEVIAVRDFYARQLRLVDAAIQQTNWTTDIEVNDTVMNEFEAR